MPEEIYKAEVEQRLVGTNILIKILNFFTRILEFLSGIKRKGIFVEYEDKILVTATVTRWWFFKGDEQTLVLNKKKISAASSSYSKRIFGTTVEIVLFVAGFTEPQSYAIKDDYKKVQEKVEGWVGSDD
jgi:hypothetical protein